MKESPDEFVAIIIRICKASDPNDLKSAVNDKNLMLHLVSREILGVDYNVSSDSKIAKSSSLQREARISHSRMNKKVAEYFENIKSFKQVRYEAFKAGKTVSSRECELIAANKHLPMEDRRLAKSMLKWREYCQGVLALASDSYKCKKCGNINSVKLSSKCSCPHCNKEFSRECFFKGSV